ncbi:hypothetical protein BN2476_80140 [Paraburkholderia piptadeniae]|uniref:Uncharacterized protein n=1 Tax=Paraburkholderia piptadeniae TaxID=1701573 RepID=A0A1N7RMI4_9BURK|nr:hypothetical protein BN2476_80140 [Paraburkholderia piptadeniae]
MLSDVASAAGPAKRYRVAARADGAGVGDAGGDEGAAGDEVKRREFIRGCPGEAKQT